MYLSRFIVVLYLNCLCDNLAYGLEELNKTYLLKSSIVWQWKLRGRPRKTWWN